MGKQRAIVLDVDGVILNSAFLFDEIFQLGLKGNEMWDYFHKHCNSDKVKLIPNFYDLYVSLYSMAESINAKIVLLTSRNESVKEETKVKLRKEGIFYDELYMRPNTDYREASILKKETLQELLNKYNIIMYIDDDLKNCEAAKELGIYSLRKV